jgi:hypothetical protein
MLAYGVANLVQDLWHEQVVKRGSSDWDIPSVLVPEPSVMWGLMLAAAAAFYAVGFVQRPRAAIIAS